MNALCYKIVFSKRLGSLVAVGEHTSGQGKAAGTGVRAGVFPEGAGTAGHGASGNFVGLLKSVFASVAISCVTTGLATAAGPAVNTLPTGYSVNSGNVAISSTSSATNAAMTIQQTTDKASINWQSFSIGSGAAVNIQQNSASSVLLNRVVGNDPSQIFGKLTANGQVILINPNGIVFGKGGSVTASAFTASTFGMTEEDFKKGKNKFTRNGSTASVTVEEGANITTTVPGGYVALIASTVNNQGRISTQQGAVVLAAGESVALPAAMTDSVGIPLSSKVRLELAPSTINASVENGGTITTEGGQVLMQAAALSDAVASITHTGTIDTTGMQGGAVTLQADQGNIKVTGSIKSNSTAEGHKGGDIVIGRDEETGVLAKSTDVSHAKLETQKGFVETSGHDLKVDNASVKAANWLLDPDNIEITNGTATTGFSAISASTLSAALTDGTTVTINTTPATGTYNSVVGNGGTGKILVKDAITKSTGSGTASLSLIADDTITLSNAISASSGKLNLSLTAANGISGSGNMGLNGGALTLNTVNAGATGALSGVISGTGTSLTKSGLGQVTLAGTNTYTGTTTISKGTLQIGNGTSGTIGSGAISIDGANTELKFVNAGSNQVGIAQTITGNGIVSADKAIAFNGAITINKSAVDGNNNLTLKTTGADNTLIGQARTLNLNNSIVQAVGAGDVKLTVEASASLYANSTGFIGTTGTNLGKLDVKMTSLGKDQSGSSNSIYSLGMSLAKAIYANGGTVTLTANQGNTNAALGGTAGALMFGSGSGITANSFTATGTNTAGNVGAGRAGISTSGTTNFTITGGGTGTFTGVSNSNDTPWSVGIYTAGTINLNSGTGQIKMEAASTRSEANVNTKSTDTGAVTLGVSAGNWFQRSGTVTAQTGTLNIVGTTVQTYNAQAAIKGSNGTIINMTAPSIVLGSVPVTNEGAPSIGLATGATGYALNITADNLNIRTGTITATTSVGTGTVSIKNFTSGTKFNIGGSDVAAVGATPATLGLTNVELNTITASKLVIGSGTAGDVTVSNAVTTNSTSGNVKVITGGNIAVNAALTIGNTGDKNLTLSAEGANSQITGTAAGVIKANQLLLSGSNTATVALAAAAHQVNTLAASVKSLTFQNGKSLTVGSVADVVSGSAVNGINTTAGASVLTTAGTSANPNNLTLAKDITNSGIGNVVVGAGVTSSEGVADTGDVKSTGGKVTNSGTTYIYSGKASGTDNLSTLDSSLTSLVINGLTTQNTDTNVAYNSNSLGISGSTASAQVMFREKLTIAATDLAGTTVTGIKYGDAATAITTEGQTALLAETQRQLKGVNTGEINTTLNGLGTNNIKISKSVVIDSLSGSLSTPALNSTSTNITATTHNYGALTSSKYTASIAAGAVKVAVSQKALTGSISQGNTTYGDPLVAGTTVNFINKVGADDVSASGVAIDTTGLTSNSGNLKAGTHTGIQSLKGLTGEDSGNYTFADVKGDYTVNQKPLTALYAANNKEFDGNTNAVVTATLKDIIAGDTVTANHTSAKFASPDVGTNISVTVEGISLVGADASNYKVNPATNPGNKATATASITARPPTPPTPVVPTNNAGGRVKIPTGSGNPFALASAEDLADDSCSANSIENCHCEESTAGEGVSICYEPKAGGKGAAR